MSDANGNVLSEDYLRGLSEGCTGEERYRLCDAADQMTRLRSDLASALSGGGGHVFEGGTPEAMRDARLRNAIFNCVEQHPAKPKIATWHYAKALQLISDYRAELGAQAELTEAERPDVTEAWSTVEHFITTAKPTKARQSAIDALAVLRETR